jgi:hypothetical protein
MKNVRLVLLAMLLIVPFAATAHSQVAVGIGVGPAVVAAPYAYGPPACDWGYYAYYPYSCAPYGYYGPTWFAGGVFIGAGPWYHYGWGHYGYGYHGGYGYHAGYGYHVGYGAPRPMPYGGGGYRYGGTHALNGAGYAGGGHVGGGFAGGAHISNGFAGGGHVGGGFAGGGFHGGGGGGFHGGGGHR